jgi:hypothetical protein
VIIDIFLDALKHKDIKVIEKRNLAKFIYKNQKFSVRVSRVCFAYRKNKDEYRVQVNEENREKLKLMHTAGYWSVIFGYHEKSDTFTAWDNKLLFSSRAKNRSMYTRESLLFKVNEKKFSNYMYEDQFLKKNTISISMKPINIFKYLDIIRVANIHREEVFNQVNNSMLKN